MLKSKILIHAYPVDITRLINVRTNIFNMCGIYEASFMFLTCFLQAEIMSHLEQLIINDNNKVRTITNNP